MKNSITAIIILLSSFSTATAQTTSVRDFVEKLPLRDYTESGITLRYYAEATRVDSAEYIDWYLNKPMQGATGNAVESFIRVFKNVGCLSLQQVKGMLQNECKLYSGVTITNVRVLSEGNDLFGETPVVMQGEIIAGQSKFWRTCVAYLSAKQMVFQSFVYPQNISSDYYKRFTVKWPERAEKNYFLQATIKLPTRFVAERSEEGNALYLMKCDVEVNKESHVSVENFTDTRSEDEDLVAYFTGEELEEKQTYPNAKKLYEALGEYLKTQSNCINVQQLGLQTINATVKPTEVYRIVYTMKPLADGYYTSIEEVLVSFNKNVYRFRIAFPSKSATTDSRQVVYANRIKEIIYSMKPY